MLESIDYKWVLAGIAACISLCNLVYYLSTVIKGKTKPHMFSWVIWGLAMCVSAVAQIGAGGGAGGYYILLLSANCFIIALFGYLRGTKYITRSDTICLVAALIAIALWPLTKSPLLSIILLSVIDLIGCIPTIRKAYNTPNEENLISFSIYGVTYSLSILALSTYNLITVLYPASLVLSCWGIALLLIIRLQKLGYKVWA